MPNYPEFKDLAKATKANAKYKAARAGRQGCARCGRETGHTKGCK